MNGVDALQATLTAEHAAVYLYGVLGGQASRSPDIAGRQALAAAFNSHRARRDQLIDLLSARKVVPAASAIAYDMPAGGPATIEQRCLPIYGQLVEATTGAERTFAIASLHQVAAAAVGFGAQPSNFPGK